MTDKPDGNWRTLAHFDLPSEPGSERRGMELASDAVRGLEPPPAWLERFKTAIAEAVLNAIEHGNQYRAELPVDVEIRASDDTVTVRVTDYGSQTITPAPAPDLKAKLAGEQSPRGWGLFLIEKMVDRMRIFADGTRHTVELIMDLKAHDGDP